MAVKFDPKNSNYRIVKIETEQRDKKFEFSINEFTEYYHIQSVFDVQHKLVRLYEFRLDDKTIGFITLAMAHIRPTATVEIKEKEINGNIPALLISHLSVHKDFQRRGIGTMLLNYVFAIVPQIESLVGCRYILLNPLDDQGVRDFYLSNKFRYYSNFKNDRESDAFLMDLKNIYFN